MPRHLNGYRVFVASTGGLEDERQTVRDEIDRFNRDLMHESGSAFTAEGWEQVPGSKRRAQALINEQLERCDFMVLLLWNRWGTPPDKDGTFSSGVEEEFRLACSLIEKTTAPMQDILVLFKGVSEAQLSDPGPQLESVLKFKTELQESKEWFYKTFDSIHDLRSEVKSGLLAWAQLTSGNKQGRSDTLDQTDSIATTPSGHLDDTPSDILGRAESFARRGLVTQAEAAYAQAVLDGGIDALESYAQFLRRIGRLSRSLEIGQQIIEQLTRLPESAETSVRISRVMASRGVTQRKLGLLRKSRYSLREAVQAIDGESEFESKALAYAFDNLGITAVRSGDMAAARNAFNKALLIRTSLGDDHGRGETLLNRARLEHRSGEMDSAFEDCQEALALFGTAQDISSLAAAHALMGEIREAAGDSSGAEHSFREALHRNESAGRPANIALSQLQLARLLLKRGDLAEAERLAERANQENTQASNREGAVAAQHLLGRVAAASGHLAKAVGLLEDCVSAYTEMGNPTGEGWARVHLAESRMLMGQEAEASEILSRVAAIAETTNNAALRAASQST